MENQAVFTKDEIWEAILQLGGQEDMNADEVEESKKQLFDVLDAIVLNRGEKSEAPSDAAPSETPATPTPKAPASGSEAPSEAAHEATPEA